MSAEPRSSSSVARIGLGTKVREAVALGRMHLAKRSTIQDFQEFERDFAQYRAAALRHVGRPLEALRVFELGYGARPIRLSWLHSQGVDIAGADLDTPVISFDWGKVLDAARRNGLERAAKSVARELLVGDKEWRDAASAFERRNPGRKFRIPKEAMIVGDAADPAVWKQAGPVDFVYSEDVLEHIPIDRLPMVLSNIAAALSPDGVAFLRPHVFTGIGGGHDVEWYLPDVANDRPRRTAPWEHLRQDRYPANTYLNRAGIEDYARLFSVDFEILEQFPKDIDLGRPYLTDEIRAELARYSEMDLMTDRMTFILRPRRAGAAK